MELATQFRYFTFEIMIDAANHLTIQSTYVLIKLLTNSIKKWKNYANKILSDN